MGSTRPLRDAFNEVSSSTGHAGAASPDQVLREAGHPDLPVDLLGEAVVNFADTAPPEVAEHLAPLIMTHTGIVPGGPDIDEADPTQWLDRLATAPVNDSADHLLPDIDLDGIGDLGSGHGGHVDRAETGSLDDDPEAALLADPIDLDFGHGSDPAGADPSGAGLASGSGFAGPSSDGEDPTAPWYTELDGQDPAATPTESSLTTGSDGPAGEPADPFFDDLSDEGGPEDGPGGEPPMG